MSSRFSSRFYAFMLVGVILVRCGGSAQSPVSGELRASGFIEARTYTLAAEFGGTVAEVSVARGESVSAGQPLVRIVNSSLQGAYDQATAEVTAARANLVALQEQPRQESIAAAQAAVDKAEAELDAARAALDLLRATFSPLDPPVDELHRAEAAIAIALAGVDVAAARLEQVRAGPAPGELDLARNILEGAEARQSLAALQVDRLVITAPVDGLIGQVLVQPGEVAVGGSPLVQVFEPLLLTLRIYLPAARVALISPGDPVEVQVDAYPGESFPGTVRRIADQAQFTPTNVQTQEERVKLVFAVDIDLENPDGRLNPGIPADAVILP